MDCPLCQNKKFTKIYVLCEATIYRCGLCSLFIKHEKTKARKKLYDDNYYDAYPYSHAFGLTKRYFKAKIGKIKKLIEKERPCILDIGCGWGDFLEVVDGEGLPYLGIDLSPKAITITKKKNLSVRNVSLETLMKEKKQFDVVTSFQTIEHLVAPLAFLKKVRRLLTKRGIILLTTPNNDSPLRFLARGQWSVYNIPSHYVFFNKKTLRLTLEKSGFTNVKVRIDSPRFFSLGYILSCLNFPMLNNQILKTIPIPTDPLGDLEAIAGKEQPGE